MSTFIDYDFLLDNKTASTLYHEHAAKMPIIDYHCHIDAAEIYNNRQFADLSELWLAGDHYKWRLMRAYGVGEELITGETSGWEKFQAFAKVLPLAIANPVYHWAHLELQRFFNVYMPLSTETAEAIWEKTCSKLSEESSLSARGIIKRMNVEVIVTTDDPIDSLEWHSLLASDDSFKTKVLPCFRPDMAMNIEGKGFVDYMTELFNSSDIHITSYDDLKAALLNRIEHFDSCGCRAADHGMFRLTFSPSSENEVREIFLKGLHGKPVDAESADKYRYSLFTFLAEEYARRDWVMELHLGVMRDVNTPMYDKLGANTGFDTIGVSIDIPHLARVLNSLNMHGNLPKTIIFPINPNDNAAVNTLAACFSAEGVRGKVQQGSAWWFNDTLGGIKKQLQDFAEYGVLSNFVGMLTDSRSFTSYTRHEYFRRILCGFIGDMVDKGLYPDDFNYLSLIAKDISCDNAKRYFGF